ncbi:MAG: SRPBCC family protein, partial [bacterium]
MTRLLSQIHIAQPIEKVFAYVTTAESWPKWHPASLLVEGAIDHSAQVGEQIIEQIKVGGLRDCVVWTVLEHEPPRRWVFEGKGDRGGLAKISYTL